MSNALQKLNGGTVEIHGETIDLTSREGITLVNDLAREEEGVVQMDYIKRKYNFDDNDLAGLAANTELVHAIFLARQLRIDNHRATSEHAAVLHVEGPKILYAIMKDPMERAAVRIQAEERLHKLASSGGPDGQERREQVIVNIITSHNTPQGTKTIEIKPSKPALLAPDETPLQPITIISRGPDAEDEEVDPRADDADTPAS